MIDEKKGLTRYAAFLRGVNVGGNNMLPMSGLRSFCGKLGLKDVSTYIQSGNVIFKSGLSEGELMRMLEQELLKKMDKRIPVILRTIKDLQKVLNRNPFPEANPSQVGVLFFANPIPKNFTSGISTPGREKVFSTKREAYIHYPDGMGRSKLKLPKIADEGTVRNINTIRKILEIASQ